MTPPIDRTDQFLDFLAEALLERLIKEVEEEAARNKKSQE